MTKDKQVGSYVAITGILVLEITNLCCGITRVVLASLLQVLYKQRNKWYFLKITYPDKKKMRITSRYNQNFYYFTTALKQYLNISVINSGQIFTITNCMVHKIQLTISQLLNIGEVNIFPRGIVKRKRDLLLKRSWYYIPDW